MKKFKKLVLGITAIAAMAGLNPAAALADSAQSGAEFSITRQFVDERADDARVYRLVFEADVPAPGLLVAAAVMSFDADVVIPVDANSHADYIDLASSAPFAGLAIQVTDWAIDAQTGRQVFGHTSSLAPLAPAQYGDLELFAFYFRIAENSVLTADSFRLEDGRDANGFLTQIQPWPILAGVMLSNGITDQTHWWGHTQNPPAQGLVIPDANIELNLNLDAGVLRVVDAIARVGQNVNVQIRIDDNPGFAAMPLRITIPQGLTLTAVTNNTALSFTPPQTMTPNPDRNVFMGFLGNAENYYGDILLTLTFSVSDAIVIPDGDDSVSLPIAIGFYDAHNNPDSPTDQTEADVDIAIIGGNVVILPRATYMIGDANGDGRISSVDTTRIARWILAEAAGLTLDAGICHRGADVNGDGVICVADVILLSRWLVGHNVDLATFAYPDWPDYIINPTP